MSFLPLDLSSTDSLNSVISHIDYTMQYGEDEEPKEVCIPFSERSGADDYLAAERPRRGRFCRDVDYLIHCNHRYMDKLGHAVEWCVQMNVVEIRKIEL